MQRSKVVKTYEKNKMFGHSGEHETDPRNLYKYDIRNI